MMRILVFAVSLLVSVSSVSAQSINKRLFSHVTQKGTVYFIGEKRLSSPDPDIKRFEYDLTYLASGDSVTVNFTVISSNPNNIETLEICNGEKNVEATNVELLFHEIQKKNYVVRTTSRVSYQELKDILKTDIPIWFDFSRTDGQKSRSQYKPSEWKKEKELFERVFYLINK